MRVFSAMAGLLLLAGALPVRAEVVATEHLALTADFRVRFEEDFDSQTATGLARDDRTRMRIRARIAARYRPDDTWELGLRLRSGSTASQQSPHITVVDFDGNDTGDADFEPDRWYVRGAHAGWWAWAGRNSPPFWKQNEMLWDDDVTPAGLAAGWSGLGPGRSLALNAGYFSLPVGMRAFAGNLGALQVVYGTERGTTGFTAAAAWHVFDSEPSDADAAALLDGNGLRDYSILSGSLQVRLRAGGRSLVLGGDLLHNTEGYSATDPDPFTAANADRTDGFVLSASYGALDQPGDWLVAWHHARIETLAVHASYAQDDWVRWGSATETRSSGLQGDELRYCRRLLPRLDLVARLYLVEAIDGAEDGKRARVDFNFRF